MSASPDIVIDESELRQFVPKEYFPNMIVLSTNSPLKRDDSCTAFVFHKTNQIFDNCPIYKCYPKIMKRWFRKNLIIPGKTMFRIEGRWAVKNDNDMRGFVKYGSSPQTDPFGYWLNGVYVSPYYKSENEVV